MAWVVDHGTVAMRALEEFEGKKRTDLVNGLRENRVADRRCALFGRGHEPSSSLDCGSGLSEGEFARGRRTAKVERT